ncbi:MAG: mycothiol system anti-sigma-R factor [Rhodoferax sp.]|nr:mycothiol system anti-sigma-R factor [Actinomycetota bacterium]
MSCGNHHDASCRDVLDRVYEYLDNELGEPDYAKIKQHLVECGPCLRQFDLDEAVKALVRRSCSEAAPDQLRLKILGRITEVRTQFEA